MRAACVKRVQPEPAASQFSKHSLLTNYALGPAGGGLRRPAVVSMRSYVWNTKSADAIVPYVGNQEVFSAPLKGQGCNSLAPTF